MFQDLHGGAWLRAKISGFAAVAVWMLAFGSLQSAPAPELIIRHVTVIDVAGTRTQANQRITVQGGRILAIEPEQATAPRAAMVIDATGKFLIPGLWDMHAHLVMYPGLPQREDVTEVVFPLFIANGVLGVRDMGAPEVTRMVRLREEIETGKRLGPHLVVTGRQFDGVNVTDWTKQRITNTAEARQAVRALKEAGADFVKVYQGLSLETYRAIAEESTRVGLPFAVHMPLALTAREAIEAGPSTIEHMGSGALHKVCYSYLPEGAAPPPDTEPRQTARLKEAVNAAFAGQPAADVWAEGTRAWLNSALGKGALATLQRELDLVESLVVLRRQTVAAGIELAVRARQAKGERTYKFVIDQQGKIDWLADEPDVLLPGRLQQLAEMLIAHRVWVTPTLTPLRSLVARSELMKRPDPRLVYVHPEVRRQLDPANDPRYRDWTNFEWDLMKRLYARDAQLAVLLHKAGVRLLAGTDAVTDYCMPGFGLHDELALLVQAGLSPGEALRTATLNPAEFLGREKEFGSIAVGKRADLVLLERNPLNDIRNTTSVWGVIQAGQYLDRAGLDRMLEAVRKRVNQR
ncbi:MAG: amidohydrolase family protein [Blastocatellia bacterium]